MTGELIKAFLFIFIAEMGDKTQVLAMTFATKFSVKEVLTGVFLGSLINHGIAILLGTLLSSVVPIKTIQFIAGISFIGFGLWTLKIEDDELEETKNSFGPIFTVALAFFIGELGDKTQLTAMTLATESIYPAFILMGSVLGMVITSSFGIFVGSKVGEKIPEFFIKIGSSLIFTFFGILKLFINTPPRYLSDVNILLFFSILIFSLTYLIKQNIMIHKSGKVTALKEIAATLYDITHKVNEAVDEICLSENYCGNCKGKNCLIGYTKEILEQATEKEDYNMSEGFEKLPSREDKEFSESKVIYALSTTLLSLEDYNLKNDKNNVIYKTKNALEKILFNEVIDKTKDINSYIKLVNKKDKEVAKKILETIKIIRKEENN